MAKSMTKLGLTSFLDGFAMGGLFRRARGFGAPILGCARLGSLCEVESPAADVLVESNSFGSEKPGRKGTAERLKNDSLKKADWDEGGHSGGGVNREARHSER